MLVLLPLILILCLAGRQSSAVDTIAKPAAKISSQLDEAMGIMRAIGRPCLVISIDSPAFTSRSTLLASWRSSRIPTFLMVLIGEM